MPGIISYLEEKGLQVGVVADPEFFADTEAGHPDAVGALIQDRSHVLVAHPQPDQNALTELAWGEAGKRRSDVLAELRMHIVEGHFKMAPVAFSALPV